MSLHDDFNDQVRELVSASGGAVVLEHLRCPACEHVFYSYHEWTESLQCTRCKGRVASRVPRRPEKGEVTLHHLATALATLKEMYGNVPHCRFSTGEEWNALPPEARDAINSNISAAAVAVLKQVEGLAISFATKQE